MSVPARFAQRTAPAAVLLGIVLAHAALAQGLLSKSGDEPVTIHADDGIEWVRDAKKYVARGNASATRNDATIRADTLTAYYREKTEGKGQDIFRVDAIGDVRISTKEQQATGDKGVYHVDKAVFVLVGKNLRFQSTQGVLTARDSLEYWEERGLAVARGNAIVTQENQRMRADIMTAHIAEETVSTAGTADSGPLKLPQGSSRIKQVDAFGNVHISMQKAIVRGDTGVYVPARGVATICGNVRITSGTNQLNGKCAEVNLKTGIYRLTGRAKGLVAPSTKPKRR
ncbi:MAG: hypothetical protein MJE12_18865 [Alphaproteobacteria bacterium]|nr:hypothetical protein [Alphaproteobacteria bacterium]